MEDINNLLYESLSTIKNQLNSPDSSLKNLNKEYIKREEFINEINNINKLERLENIINKALNIKLNNNKNNLNIPNFNKNINNYGLNYNISKYNYKNNPFINPYFLPIIQQTIIPMNYPFYNNINEIENDILNKLTN